MGNFHRSFGGIDWGKILKNDQLEKIIGYTFQEKKWLGQALTHRSAGPLHNERLEFLGDSLLNSTITCWLYDQLPDASEGQLTHIRAHLVQKDQLLKLAKRFHIMDFIKLGPGEKSTCDRQGKLADCIEAIIGAIYLDSKNKNTHQQCIIQWYQPWLNELKQNWLPPINHKTMLQEHLQKKGLPLPTYTLQNTTKPPQRHFDIKCSVAGLPVTGEGHGQTKKMAEQAAAYNFWHKLQEGRT
jgi:ribonuclease III